MALTITTNLRENLGTKAIRGVSITHDGSVLTLTAGSIDLHYFDFVLGHIPHISNEAIASAVITAKLWVSIAANHTDLIFGGASAGSKSYITVAGW
jgi:hypothetical protein